MWISNPLTSALFVPLASTLGCLLSIGLCGVLIGQKFSSDLHLRKQLIVRWFSWLALSIVGLICVLSGPASVALLTSLVALVGTFEYCQISQQKSDIRLVLCLLAVLMPFAALLQASYIVPVAFAGLLLISLLSLCVAVKFDRMALSILGVFYVPFLASHMPVLYQSPSGGSALVIAVIASSALANIMAFVFGKAFRGPKLAPDVSPNKTWSGVAGSFFGSYLGFISLAAASSLSISGVAMLLVPLVVAVSGIVGDLFESSLKRFFGMKDAGNCLPGFGGALDRIDGLLFVVPAVYYLTGLLSGV